MVPRPKEVKPLNNFSLQVLFDNGETKIYDMSKLIEEPFYRKLKNKHMFNTVKVSDITLEWASGERIYAPMSYIITVKVRIKCQCL